MFVRKLDVNNEQLYSPRQVAQYRQTNIKQNKKDTPKPKYCTLRKYPSYVCIFSLQISIT